MSSSYYIINDIVDRKEDRLHPAKKHRPIASGLLFIPTAIVLIILLFLSSLFIAFLISPLFFTSVFLLFISSQLYIFYFKKKLFLDVIFIAINFVIRAASGIFIVTTTNISPWNLIGAFFLAIILALGKRKAELHALKAHSSDHRSVLAQYKTIPIDSFILISITFLLVSYAIYSVFEGRPLLVLTIPVTFYALTRYVTLSYTNLGLIGRPERLFSDKPLLISMILWILMVIAILYF